MPLNLYRSWLLRGRLLPAAVSGGKLSPEMQPTACILKHSRNSCETRVPGIYGCDFKFKIYSDENTYLKLWYWTILSHEVQHKRSKENIFGEGCKRRLYLGEGEKEHHVEGTQAMPARPSDNDRMRLKTLWSWVVKAWDIHENLFSWIISECWSNLRS
jgi:hypothetical protein